jgi:hypothetical protein
LNNNGGTSKGVVILNSALEKPTANHLPSTYMKGLPEVQDKYNKSVPAVSFTKLRY